MYSCNPPSDFSTVQSLRFPQKLWKIVNECNTGSVSWGSQGKSILLCYSLFQEEFMNSHSDFFKTSNITSFIRQLNLYGFRKVYHHVHRAPNKHHADVHEFKNKWFIQGRADLLEQVTRKSAVVRTRCSSKSRTYHLDRYGGGGAFSWDTTRGAKSKFRIYNDADDAGDDDDPGASGSDDDSDFWTPGATHRPRPHHHHHGNKRAYTKQANGQQRVLRLQPANQMPTSDFEPRKRRYRKLQACPATPAQLLQQIKPCYSAVPLLPKPCPSLKLPEEYPNSIYFAIEEHGDKIASPFLGEKSCDVMLSSAAIAPDDSEAVELRELYSKCLSLLVLDRSYRGVHAKRMDSPASKVQYLSVPRHNIQLHYDLWR